MEIFLVCGSLFHLDYQTVKTLLVSGRFTFMGGITMETSTGACNWNTCCRLIASCVLSSLHIFELPLEFEPVTQKQQNTSHFMSNESFAEDKFRILIDVDSASETSPQLQQHHRQIRTPCTVIYSNLYIFLLAEHQISSNQEFCSLFFIQMAQ